MQERDKVSTQKVNRQRRTLLRRLSRVLDAPMTFLSFVWLALMIVEFTSGLSPILEAVNYVIWSLFVFHFALEFWIAPAKSEYVKANWLTALALLLPAFRMLRTVRALRIFSTANAGRGVRLARWLTSLNRGMKATQSTLRRRGLRYVLALTLLITLAGAAGIYLFENPQALREAGYLEPDNPEIGIRSYGESLWWTSMMLTTMGSDYFPRSTEGRVLALLLAVYAFAIFGYITAVVASVILQEKRPNEAALLTGLQRQVAEMQGMLLQLRQDFKEVQARSDGER